jgi:hypothetical protein
MILRLIGRVLPFEIPKAHGVKGHEEQSGTGAVVS